MLSSVELEIFFITLGTGWGEGGEKRDRDKV